MAGVGWVLILLSLFAWVFIGRGDSPVFVALTWHAAVLGGFLVGRGWRERRLSRQKQKCVGSEMLGE
ncbi:hypothetical protein SAMN00808754_1408 [Thermanaeromonas toyohensis ToBE]|uniref:Uncharacterized protein n=1 Tax=Thermanaeromonas toyohensis ToBE TaxID=698762 RepID=A0A1W1VS05_9FIRM|nr:hypothetical protein SAMN00808754_1408 [Thermanaeromonas toyohensis ToBE]